MEMNKLRFGTAGIPRSTNGDTVQGIKDVREMGLENFELEFVRSVNIKKEKAPEVKKAAKENDVILTCHAPFYINLNSEDVKKFHASISYITSSAKILSLCGGYSVCFHPGYYQKQDPKVVYGKIKEGIKKIVKEVQEYDNKIWIRPETQGKPTQFGNLKEVLQLSQEVEQVMPCIDFSHMHAYTNGKYNTTEEFNSILQDVEKTLGKKGLNNMHIHLTGIDYSEKGEKKHLILKDSDMNYKDLIKTWKDFKIKGVVVSESPNIEEDALLMQKEYLK
ncbi:hypothetical protein CL617_01095 [archaeon]|nr:hypothetical protein [archaeon]|tara:strand:- start:5136 stop:5966 length:831 start_codon:yes stop_codon:yes gene_type:complete